MPAAITLQASKTSTTFPVRFYGEAAEDSALAFIARRQDLTFAEIEEERIGDEFTRLIEALYPTCQHGMSLDLCEGPDHYPSAYDEMVADYYRDGFL